MNKLKKVLFIIVFIILLFVLQSSHVFADTKDINFTYNDINYTLTQFDNSNYNANTDAFIVIHSQKSDFNSFGAIVLKNAKTYIDEGAIITLTKTGYTKFYALKTGNDYYNKLLSFYLFKYDMNRENWRNWGGLTTESEPVKDVSQNWTTIIKNDINLFYDKDTIAFRNNWLNEPYIANTDSTLQNMTTDSLLIFPGDYIADSYNLRFALRIIEDKGDYISETNLVRIELNSQSPFYHNVEGDIFYEIPFTSFPNTVSLVAGQKYNWLLAYDDYGTNYINRYLVSNVDYQFTGGDSGGGDSGGGDNTNAIIESQAQTTDAVRESTNAIKDQTESINENNNFIKDDSISDDNFILPDDSSNDISKQGIENIFDLLYNSFTSGEAQDIVLPIPFTSKNIIIPSNYLENIFNNSNFNFLLMFIHAFYYFIVSSFIVKDIQKKFDKIKSGNIENLQNDNIKADML